jgi:hypothetical protein
MGEIGSNYILIDVGRYPVTPVTELEVRELRRRFGRGLLLLFGFLLLFLFS